MIDACPKCRTVSLGTPPGARAEQGVKGCSSCGGLFVPQRQIEALASGEAPFELQWNPPKPVSPAADRVVGMCPEGHGLMTRARIELSRWFMLERCGTCGGIWFDGGEWAEVAGSPMIRDLTRIWAPEYRKQLAHQHAAQVNQRMLAERLGQPLVDTLEALAAKLRDSPHRAEALAFLQQQSEHRTA